jgi:hypothetical protein
MASIGSLILGFAMLFCLFFINWRVFKLKKLAFDFKFSINFCYPIQIDELELTVYNTTNSFFLYLGVKFKNEESTLYYPWNHSSNGSQIFAWNSQRNIETYPYKVDQKYDTFETQNL